MAKPCLFMLAVFIVSQTSAASTQDDGYKLKLGNLLPIYTPENIQYAKELAREINAKKSLAVELKEGWKLVRDQTRCSNRIRGSIVDQNGVARVSYGGKTGFYDSFVHAYVISKDEALRIFEENAKKTEADKPEIAAEKWLWSTMGKEVFRHYEEVEMFLYDNSCQRGYGSLLPRRVNPVLEWYHSGDARTQMDAFLAGSLKETKVAKRFNQFLEMFVKHKDLGLIARICSEQDVGMAALFGGFETGNDLYEKWKSVKR